MNIPISTGILPSNFCPSDYQALANGLGAIFSVNTGSGSSASVTISSTKPSDTTVIWARIDSLGRFIGLYIYGQGAWLYAHSLLPGATVWWFSALPNFSTYDGGDSGSLGPQSGPMWQQARDFNGNVIAAQFLLTPGTLPSGAIVNIGDTGGEEKHVTTLAESPPHMHLTVTAQSPTSVAYIDANSYISQTNNPPDSGNAWYALNIGPTVPPTAGPTAPAGGVISTDSDASAFLGYTDKFKASAHNVLPVYVTGYLLQRTTRLFYAVN